MVLLEVLAPVSLGRAVETALSPPSTVPQPSFCIFEVAFVSFLLDSVNLLVKLVGSF